MKEVKEKKDNNSCNGIHKALFCTDSKNLNNEVKCICLTCGEFVSVENPTTKNNIIYGQIENNNSFEEYYEVRMKYLYYVQNNNTPEEAIKKINSKESIPNKSDDKVLKKI